MTTDLAPQSDSSSEANRRSFLAWTLKAGSIAVPAVAMAATSSEAGVKASANASKNYGHSLPEAYSGANRRNFLEIQADENLHVQAIESVLTSSGVAIPPYPTFQNLQAPTYAQFAALSATFENTGVTAYLGALAYVSNPLILSFAGSIATIEAYHSGWLNTLLDRPISPNRESFSMAATQAQIVAAISPFIASLNSPLPVISSNKSEPNDIAILEFALILERLEQTYYNINVPKLFP